MLASIEYLHELTHEPCAVSIEASFTNTIDILAVICTSFEIATVIPIYPIAQWRGAEWSIFLIMEMTCLISYYNTLKSIDCTTGASHGSDSSGQ